MSAEPFPFKTLPDYLRRNLDLVLIGINPGTYSVERGHYFARKTSRFWPAFSKSRLSEPIRRALAIEQLLPEHDSLLPRFGIGLTDLVKRSSANASSLTADDFSTWTPRLLDKLRRFHPRVACFHGVMAFQPFLRIALRSDHRAVLGPQTHSIGRTRLFVVPNPSPANAHFTPADQAEWYNRLADFIASDKRR